MSSSPRSLPEHPSSRDVRPIETARDIIATAGRNIDRILAAPHPEVRPSGNATQRRRTARRLARHYRPALLGAVASPDSRRAAFAMIYPIGPNAGNVEGLAVFQESHHLDADVTAQGIPLERTPAAHVDVHAISRLIERRQVIDLAGVTRALSPALGWSLAAQHVGLKGTFFLPDPQGMFACERAPYIADGRGAPIVRIKTYIHQEGMSAFHRAARQVLLETCEALDAPRIPSLSGVSADHAAALNRMREIGHQWERRRAGVDRNFAPLASARELTPQS